MSIIGSLKRLIFGTRHEPVEHVPMRALPDLEKTQFSSTGANELQFSDAEKLAAQHRAETVLREFNESLNSANLSKSRKIREHKLKLAREGLFELKELANKFPFLHLLRLQAVEASIIAVEAETLVLTDNEIPEPSISNVSEVVQSESLAAQGKEIESSDLSDHDRQSFNAGNEQDALMCIQSCFGVVNESIEIARKSKNLETIKSRLGVARNSLKQARTQANQFSLKVDGFDAAEAEISRLDEAVKTGKPTELSGMQQIDANAAFSSAARNLLKDATALKREKRFVEACEKLREAYSADGAENLMIEDRLRLPMYLQLAGKNDDGWNELNRLYRRYTDQFSGARIEHQMQVFLRKENNETALNPVREFLRIDHTSIPQAAIELRMAEYRANSYLVSGVRWLATLDAHTCPRCGALDGQTWQLDGTPINATVPMQTPPLHINCRCVLSPQTHFSNMGGGQRASQDGPVDRKTTYTDFLRGKNKFFQDEVLGPGRAQMWRDGLITLSQLFDGSGRELSLTELRAKYDK